MKVEDAASWPVLRDADAAGRMTALARVRRLFLRGLGLGLPPLAGLGLLILLWAQLAAYKIIPAFLLPAPAAIAHEFRTNGAMLLRHAGYTSVEALAGFAAGTLAAVVTAFLFAYIRPVRDCLYPLALVSRTVPFVAVTPLLVIVFGFGATPIIVLVSIAVFFPTLLNMVAGLMSAEVDYRELLYTLSASPAQRMRMVELPAALPFLFAAMKVGASAAFIVAVISEWIAARAGLGYLVQVSSFQFRLPTMWAAILLAAVLTLLLLGAVTAAEAWFMRWRRTGMDDR